MTSPQTAERTGALDSRKYHGVRIGFQSCVVIAFDCFRENSHQHSESNKSLLKLKTRLTEPIPGQFGCGILDLFFFEVAVGLKFVLKAMPTRGGATCLHQKVVALGLCFAIRGSCDSRQKLGHHRSI